MSKFGSMLHSELRNSGPVEGATHNGQRLDHAEGTSQPMASKPPEAQPRGAVIHGDRPVDQSEAANRFIAATEHEKMHDERLWDLRVKRDREMHGMPEWEELRRLASAIKEHTLTHLDQYLEQFETNARANGVHVHWAKDAEEHNTIVLGILRDHNAKRLIKSKSMLTEECNFREFMDAHGIEVIETDLGERIQQLDGEAPSHVVAPAVHKLRTDVARLFAEKLGSDPETERETRRKLHFSTVRQDITPDAKSGKRDTHLALFDIAIVLDVGVPDRVSCLLDVSSRRSPRHVFHNSVVHRKDLLATDSPIFESVTGLHGLVDGGTQLHEIEGDTDFSACAPVRILAPYVVGIFQREAASISAAPGAVIIIGCREVRGFLKSHRRIGRTVLLQLLTVVRVGIREVPVTIDPVEIEMPTADRSEQVLDCHDPIENLPLGWRNQQWGMGFDQPQRGVKRRYVFVFGHGCSLRQHAAIVHDQAKPPQSQD
jgi:LUD domain